MTTSGPVLSPTSVSTQTCVATEAATVATALATSRVSTRGTVVTMEIFTRRLRLYKSQGAISEVKCFLFEISPPKLQRTIHVIAEGKFIPNYSFIKIIC